MMSHLTNFALERFRGLRDLRLEQPGRINLLVGNNNAGKTSVLEALAVYCSPLNLARWVAVAQGRDPYSARQDALLRSLFPQGEWRLKLRGEDASRSYVTEGEYSLIQQISEPKAAPSDLAQRQEKLAQISADIIWTTDVGAPLQIQDGIRLSLRADGQEPVVRDIFANTRIIILQKPRLPWALLRPFSPRPSDSELHKRAVDLGLRDDVRKMVQLIDPSIHHIENLDGELHVTDLAAPERKPMPISWFGDGVRRCLSYALAMIECRGGLLLIDELESAIHTSTLTEVFRALLVTARKQDVQVFATTHSLEAIDAILDACKEQGPDEVVVYQVQRDRVKRFGQERLTLVREEMGVDIRRSGGRP